MAKELLRTIVTKAKEYGVFLMDNKSKEHQVLFLNSFYKSFGAKPQLDSVWFEWFYTKNPLGQCNNYIILDLYNNQWVGGFGFSKKSYCVGDNNRVGGLAINGFINPGHEGQGLYTQLIATGLEQENYFENSAFSFPHSKNISSIKGHLNSGWRRSIKLSFFETIITGKERDNFRVAKLFNPNALSEIDFEKFKLQKQFQFVRNYQELSWRYIDRPDKKYIYLSVIEPESIGYMILGAYTSRDGVRRLQIADYRYSSQEVLCLLIEKSWFIAAEERYQFLDVLINPDSSALMVYQGAGFTERQEGYELLIFSKENMQIPRDLELDFGDFDVV